MSDESTNAGIMTDSIKERKRRRHKKSRSHQCYYKVGGRYVTPKQAARKRRKRRK